MRRSVSSLRSCFWTLAVVVAGLLLASWTPLAAAKQFTLTTTNLLTLCASINTSPDVNNTVALGSYLLPLTFTCTTSKNVAFTGSTVFNLVLNFYTTGYMKIQNVNFKDYTSITLGNAAALELTGVRFTTTSVLVATALTVSGVARAELNECSFTGSRATQAAVSFANCGSVVVDNVAFYNNQANIVGGIRANGVAALAITDSTFAYNSGSTAHVLSAVNSNVTVSGANFLSNGKLLDTGKSLMAVTGGSFVMSQSHVTLNWGATIALSDLASVSGVIGSTFDLNFNSRSRPLIDVAGCNAGFQLQSSVISYNLGGGLHVQDCAAEVSGSKLWAQGSFGVLCGSQATINAQSASIYKNGWTFVGLFQPSHFIDTACEAGCSGLLLYGGIDACSNATDTVRGYDVSCKRGLNKCSQCQQEPRCTDCNGLPFGNATTELCEKWNTIKSSGARVNYNGTSPTCLLTATPSDSDVANASIKLQYDTVTVYYFNTSSNAEEALYRFPINDSDYTRSRGAVANDQFCINYERVLDNGAGLLLQQCLFEGEQTVMFGNQTITVPKDHVKITVSLSNMISFDNQTRNNTDDIDITTRRVAVELSMHMSEEGNMGAVPSDQAYLDALKFAGDRFSMSMELPNYAIFSDGNASTFAYSLDSSDNKTAEHKLVLDFMGAFDTVYYDPQFGLLLGSGRDGSSTSDDGVLVQILVPVLVGAALLVVVLFAIGFAAWYVWQKRVNNRKYQSSTSMINFAVNEA